MVSTDVPDDGFGVLRVVLLLHCLHHRSQLLAHQSVRCGHHQHFFCHPKGHVEECLRCGAVSVLYLPRMPVSTSPRVFRLAPRLDDDDGWAVVDGKRIQRNNRIKEIYENIRWCWVALALASLVLQATRQVDISPTHQDILDKGELVLTIVFDIEIFIRLAAHLPDWRSFFFRGQNWLDLTLAIGSSIIQIPAIHNSSVYPWLTIFQLTRFYRVILEIPRMKPLLVSSDLPSSNSDVDLVSSWQYSVTCMVWRTCPCSSS